MSESAIRRALGVLAEGSNLTSERADAAVGQIIDGEASEVEIAAFLSMLAARGETAAVLAGAIRAVRRRMIALQVPPRLRPLLDTCGSGGDGAGTVNVSSAVALVVSACGVRVAKHGNRSASGRSGSAEVFSALGVRIDAEPPVLIRCLEEVGIAFLFAPAFHPALKHAGPVRKQLPYRTLFNLVGPLANPARAEVQLIGVPDQHRAGLVAETLAQLGSDADGPDAAWPRRAVVACSGEGLDEVSLGSASYLRQVEPGQPAIDVEIVDADSFGLPTTRASELAIEHAADSAERIRAGVALAALAIDQGEALRRLERWAALSHERPAA